MLRRLLHPVLLFPAALACASPVAPSPEGSWGGPEASLSLTRSGGTLSYACGAGIIDSTWTLTQDGRFAATGQHFFGGGPLPPQGHPPHPAHYAGQIRGSDLFLTVTLTDLDLTLGPYRLERGGPVVSEQCL